MHLCKFFVHLPYMKSDCKLMQNQTCKQNSQINTFFIHLVFNETCKFQTFINEILRFKHIMSRKEENAPEVLVIRLKYF